MFLEKELKHSESYENEKLMASIKTHSPMSWAHINLLGEYDFSDKKCIIHAVFYLPKFEPNFIVISVDAKIIIFFTAYSIAKNPMSRFVPLQRLTLISTTVLPF